MMEQRYTERLKRYQTAMNNEKPDRIPIRPFVAEFTAKYAGYTCQDVTHDYEIAFEAARKCAADFNWDAVVSNMVYVWTGLTQAIGLTYYGVPGIDVPRDTGFQYREPPEDRAFMKPDEYDALIEDPTGFLYNVWLPRVSYEVCAAGEKASYRNNIALVKGGMAMMNYFSSFARQNALLKSESGTVSAIGGILKAPFDIIADKLRGYVGLTMDMHDQPKKVLAACEALMPHILHLAKTTADPDKNVPIGFWMHRGCVPFVTPDQFESHYWPTLEPIIRQLWSSGNQTLFYAEGNWNHHLERIAELPEKSIIFHIDQSDIFEAHKKLGDKFCLSGGIPNFLLSYKKPDDVREYCKTVIDRVASDGGYIMDSSAIMQNDTKEENLRAMTDFTREYGVYSSSSYQREQKIEHSVAPSIVEQNPNARPSVCLSFEQKEKELGPITGERGILKRVWEDVDSLGYAFIWQCLLSF